MVALSSLVDRRGKIPFWTLFMVYVIQSVGELCLSPIGLSMVTKLAPVRLVGLGMGGWFLSTGDRQQPVRHLRQPRQRRRRHDHGVGPRGYTFGFYASLVRFGRAAVPDRAADPAADARGEVRSG
jgi:POT family proton-dependent oligopeptide transporter